MLKTRIKRLEGPAVLPLSELSDEALDERIASIWHALSQGQVKLGDTEGLIAHLAEIEGGVVNEEFAGILRRYDRALKHQTSLE